LNAARVEHAFEKAGIPFLRWRDQSLTVNGVTLHLFGLDDFELSPNYWARFETAKRRWSSIPADEPIVALSHNPDIFPWIPARVGLTLASHTHGGQVRLPLLGSLVVPSAYGQRFVGGPIVEGGRHLFVNTGLGTSIIPVRWGVVPEVSLLLLRSKSARLRSQAGPKT
jgi:predicted MPP superfamily phosphohydrolase